MDVAISDAIADVTGEGRENSYDRHASMLAWVFADSHRQELPLLASGAGES
jgi:hypothetical protein